MISKKSFTQPFLILAQKLRFIIHHANDFLAKKNLKRTWQAVLSLNKKKCR